MLFMLVENKKPESPGAFKKVTRRQLDSNEPFFSRGIVGRRSLAVKMYHG